MIENKTTSDCTIYAFVGTAILAISLIVAMYVGNDFHQSLFVESIIFVGSNILLWAIFISMVNYPYELMTIGSNSKTKKNVRSRASNRTRTAKANITTNRVNTIQS